MSDSEFFDVGEATAAFRAVPSGAVRPPMLDFRGHDGRLLALPYARLASIVFDHVGGITLDFVGSKVLVRGRNLEPLYDALVEHRILDQIHLLPRRQSY